MSEADQYAHLSDDELAELLELEELELGAASGQVHMPDVDVDSPEHQLDTWNEEVDDFGGRISSPARRTILTELGDGQLGQRVSIPTSEPNPVVPGTQFQASHLLAEVTLAKSIPMDVTFSYDAMQANDGNGQRALDQGDGCVRVTWGTTGAFKNVALVDGNRGWRRSFVASFLRVEYLPNGDPSTQGFFPLQTFSPQQRDLLVGALITPFSPAPSHELTKTVLFPTITALSPNNFPIPRWAKSLRFMAESTGVADNFIIRFTKANGTTAGAIVSDSTATAFPVWQAYGREFPVPQRAQRFSIFAVGATVLEAPAAIFTLAL